MKSGTIIKPLHPSLASVDLKVHLDGKDSSTFTLDGTYVNNWACKGSLSADVYNTNNDTTRPTYDASTGRVTFTSANSTFLQSAAFGSALSQPNTIFIVYKITGTLNTYNWFLGNVGGAFLSHNSNFKVTGGVLLTDGATDANDNIHCALFNGASSKYWINGISKVSGNTGVSSINDILLGKYSGGGYHSNCETMEVIVYNSILPFAENYGIVLGLREKWNITI